MTVRSYLNLILITLNILCEKVTAIYTRPPYIFLKENGILVKAAVQKTEVCSFLLAHKKCKILAKPPHQQQGFTLNLEEREQQNSTCFVHASLSASGKAAKIGDNSSSGSRNPYTYFRDATKHPVRMVLNHRYELVIWKGKTLFPLSMNWATQVLQYYNLNRHSLILTLKYWKANMLITH